MARTNPLTGEPGKEQGLYLGSSTNVFNDDWYYDQIEKYKDSSFYDRLLNNPWLMNNQAEYQPGIWGSIGEFFGDYSGRVNYYNGLRTNAQQYLDDILAQMHQENYDSAPSQVAREKLAGINSDINGGQGITSGAAAENDQPFTPAIPSTGSSDLQAAFNIGSQFISTALSWVSSFQAMRSASLENDLKSLGLVNGLQDGVSSLVKEGTTEYFNGLFNSGSSIETIMDDVSHHGVYPVVKSLMDRTDRLPVSLRTRKKLRSMIEDFVGGSDGYTARYQTMVNDIVSTLQTSRNNLAKSSGLPGADSESQAALRFIGKDLYKPMVDLQLQVERLILEGKQGYHSFFNKAGGPSASASADIAAANSASSMNSLRYSITNSFSKIRKKIISSSDLSPSWKLALEASLSGVEGIVVSRVLSGQSLFKSNFNFSGDTFNSVTKTGPTVVNN